MKALDWNPRPEMLAPSFDKSVSKKAPPFIFVKPAIETAYSPLGSIV